MHALDVLAIPRELVRRRERAAVVYVHGDFEARSRPDVEAQPGVGFAALSQDKHQSPIRLAEAAGERLFILVTRRGRVSGVRVHPDAAELLRPKTLIHLPVKEVGDRLVVKGNCHRRALLANELHVFDQQQIQGR